MWVAEEAVTVILVGCLGLVVMGWAWKAIEWVWIRPRRLERQLRKQGLNGKPYRFLVGDVRESSKMQSHQKQRSIPFSNDYFSHVNPFLHQLVHKYGNNVFTWLGPIPTINITEPWLIRDAFSRINEFHKPRLYPLVGLLAPGLVSLEGHKWAQHRKLINPAFHIHKLKLMFPAFYTSIIETINKWEEMVSATGSSEIDVWPYLISLSADVISRSAFGSSYEEGTHIFQLIKQQTELTMRLLQTMCIPGWRYIPTKNNKRLKELNVQIQKLLMGIIEKRKKEMDSGKTAKDDLLGILMESNFQETQNSDDSNKKQDLGMNFQEMIDECKLFYLAGQETTSVLLVWTMILLSKHQDWQERAREEVLELFGKNEPIFDKLNHLKTMTMILNEVLRLYPPVISVFRRPINDETKLGDIDVPRGAMVSLSILHAHHDPKLWGDDALEFRPERFSEGIANATKGNVSFFPFGWGPKICIGQNFAIIEAKMALSIILQRFSFELSPSYAHAPTIVITIEPRYGAHIILRRL